MRESGPELRGLGKRCRSSCICDGVQYQGATSTSSRHPFFAEIMRELKGSGYKVSARLMNAMYFGVPQSRERMIFIGVREDLCG